MRNKPRLIRQSIIFGGVINALAWPAFATSDLSLVGGIGLEAHDNAGLTSTDERSDTKRTVSADVGYKKTDGAVNADLDYQAQYANYMHGVQSDQTAVNGRAALTWQIAAHQLDAVLSHQISQQMTDRRGLNVASNREERSIITAGLDGFLHMSPVDSLVLAPRISGVHVQESNNSAPGINNSDSKRASMATTWDHKINSVSALDLKANYENVKFDDSVNDYHTPSVMLSFHTALSRLSYQLGVGASRIERDTGKNFSGSNALAAIDYRGDDGQDWGASYARQLTDSSIGASRAAWQLTNFQSNDSNSGQFDILQEDKFDAYWRDRIGVSSVLSLSVGYQKDNYKTTPQDQSIAYAQLGYEYKLNTQWSAGLNTRFDRTKFLDDPKQKYDTTHVDVHLSYFPARPLEIRFSIAQDKRKDDASNLSYTDNAAMIGVRYRFF